MQKIAIEPCTLKYSLTAGVFVVTLDGEFNAICHCFDDLKEWLDTVRLKDAPKVSIFLSAVMDWDKDEVTHLIFSEMQGDYEDYAAWSEEHGESPFMEYWFDEWDPRTHGMDWAKRRKRWIEINRPIQYPAPAVEPVSFRVAAE